jgi:hypothetical protein
MKSMLGFSAALLLSAHLAGCGEGGPTQGGSVKITASAEELGLTGYSFPPSAGQEVAIADGWEIRFDHVITTLGHVTLSEGADKNPGDKSDVGGVVAELDQHVAVDLHALEAGDPGVVPGKGGGGELALELATITERDDGAPLDPAVRYAFGFELLPAETGADRLNLSDEANALYDQMIADGITTLVTGTATFKGTNCSQSDAGDAAPYDFGAWPTTVKFAFALEHGLLHNENCENPDNDPAEPLPGEESLRGVQVKANDEVTAQITLHTDHLFWTSTEHDSVPYFGHFAAHSKLVDGEAMVTLEDLEGVGLAELLDASGAKVPWRSCLAEVPVQTTPKYMSFDAGGLSLPGGVHDFVMASAATMGHLNSDGLCYVEGAAHEH